MTTNLFARLKAMLPDAPLLVGKVLALHPEDDTSTIQLLSGSTTTTTEGLSSGNVIRARGQFVPVGSNAFVRNGLVETKAPDGDTTDIVVGKVVVPSDPLQPPTADLIPNQSAVLGATYSFDASPYWTGGVSPRVYEKISGTLPTGLSLDPTSGVIAGVPVALQSPAPAQLRATDAAAFSADSNVFTVEVTDGTAFLAIGRFDGSLANAGVLGGNWVLATAQAQLSTTPVKYGSGSLLQHSIPYTVTGGGSGGTANPAITTFEHPSLNVALGTKKCMGFWFYVPDDGTGTAIYRGATTLEAHWSHENDSNRALGIVIAYQASTMDVYGFADDNFLNVTPVSVSRGAWHHVEVSADESNVVRWFVDGVLRSGTRTLFGALPGIEYTRLALISQGGDPPDIFVDDFFFEIGAAPVASFTPPGPL